MNTTPHHRGFTLVELLVVIAIIALLAAALLPQLSKAREHGYASRCKVNLRNLAQAALNYSVENSGYLPHAGPFEYFDQGDRMYHEAKGWVNWIPNSANKANPPTWPTNESQKARMDQPTWRGTNALLAIQAGTLWEYLNKDLNTYICPKFKKSTICGKSDPIRSYAMNSFFGCDRTGAWRNMLRLGEDASRLLMFSELCPKQNYIGKPATAISKRWINPDTVANGNNPVDAGDSVLDCEGTGSPATSAVEPYESIGYMHPLSGEHHAHVVFVDGHVEAFTVIKNSTGTITNNITQALCSGEY